MVGASPLFSKTEVAFSFCVGKTGSLKKQRKKKKYETPKEVWIKITHNFTNQEVLFCNLYCICAASIFIIGELSVLFRAKMQWCRPLTLIFVPLMYCEQIWYLCF